MNLQKQNDWMTLILMSLTAFIFSIEVTAMYVILHPMAVSLGAHSSSIAWVITTYLIVFASMIVTGGRLGDLFGHRKIIVIGLLLLAGFSVLGGFSQGLLLLLIARAGQGLACGLVWPNTTAIAFSTLPVNHKSLGIGIVTGSIGFGLAFGPIIGAAFTSLLSWRWVFLFNVPIALLIVIGVLLFVDRSIVKRVGVDVVSAILLGLALALSALFLNQIPVHSALHAWLLPIFIAAVVTWCLFIGLNRSSESPIIPTGLLKDTNLRLGCLMRCLSVIPFYICMFVVGFVLQKTEHLSVIESGLVFLPMTLMVGILSPVAGKLIGRIGVRPILLLSAVAYLVGFIALLNNVIMSSPVFMAMMLIPAGVAFALASPCSLFLGLKTVSDGMKGAANGVFYMVSIVSGLFAVALSSLILSLQLHSAMINIDMIWACAIASALLALIITIRKITSNPVP